MKLKKKKKKSQEHFKAKSLILSFYCDLFTCWTKYVWRMLAQLDLGKHPWKLEQLVRFFQNLVSFFYFSESSSRMPVKKGRLKPEDDVKIVKNYAYLKDNFDPTDGTLDYMISAMVFDRHDNDKVRNGGENTQRGRAERFIDILQNSGTDNKVKNKKAQSFTLK